MVAEFLKNFHTFHSTRLFNTVFIRIDSAPGSVELSSRLYTLSLSGPLNFFYLLFFHLNLGLSLAVLH
jgi:hypothetical protein